MIHIYNDKHDMDQISINIKHSKNNIDDGYILTHFWEVLKFPTLEIKGKYAST